MKKKIAEQKVRPLDSLLKQYRVFLEIMPSLVYDRSFTIRYAHDVFRIPSADMVGRKTRDFIVPAANASETDLKRFLSSRNPLAFTAVLRARKPAHYKLLTSAWPLEENSGVPLQFMVVPFDKEYSALYLNHTYRTQRRLSELTTDGMATVDSRQRLMICSEEIQWMSGFPARKLFGRPVSDLFLTGQFEKYRQEEKQIIQGMLQNADASPGWERFYETTFRTEEWKQAWIPDRNLKIRRVTKRNFIRPAPGLTYTFPQPCRIEEGICLSSPSPTTFMIFREPISADLWDLRIEVDFEPAILFAFFNGSGACDDSSLVTPDYTGYALGLIPGNPTDTIAALLKRECRHLMRSAGSRVPSGTWKIVFEKIGGVFRIFLNGGQILKHADPYHVRYNRQPYAGLLFTNEATVLHAIRIFRKPACSGIRLGFHRFDLNFRNRPEDIFEAEFFERWKDDHRVTDILFRKVTNLRFSQKEVADLLDRKEEMLRQIREEMDLAASVIQELLPREMPKIDGLRFASHYMPSSQIGGDFFDVVGLDDHRVALLMYDVSGHGVSAALISMMTRTLFQKIVDPAKPIPPQLEIINQELCRSFDTHFVAYFCGILDTTALTLRYAGGGLPYPALLDKERLILLEGQGLALGMREELNVKEHLLKLKTGDKLLLFTDGIYEVMNTAGEMYGRKRLMNFAENHAMLPVNALVEAILREYRTFLGEAPASDDVTLLGIEIEPTETK